jgi:hypothetical protein
MPTCLRALAVRASSESVSPVQYVNLPGASRMRSFQNGVEEYVGIEEILSSSIPSPCLGQPATLAIQPESRLSWGLSGS